MRSAFYTGVVRHERLRPRRHRLEYRVFSLLLDLDELPALDRHLPLFGVNRPALFGFHEADHGNGRTPLRQWASAMLRDAGLEGELGRIELLCYPRILGFVFNPLSVYFCHDIGGHLSAIIYEVHNTHGERHTYVLPVALAGRTVRHSARKQFFVSPFMPMECTYHFRIAPPGKRVGVTILEDDDEGRLLTASFTGAREELSSSAMWRLFWRYPLMTLKVVAGIHWRHCGSCSSASRCSAGVLQRHSPQRRRRLNPPT